MGRISVNIDAGTKLYRDKKMRPAEFYRMAQSDWRYEAPFFYYEFFSEKLKNAIFYKTIKAISDRMVASDRTQKDTSFFISPRFL